MPGLGAGERDTDMGGKCITLYISADHRRFRSKLRVLNNLRWCRWRRQGQGGPHASTPGAAGVEGAVGSGGLAAVPVGGGGAWPGFETTRGAEGSQRGRLAGGPPPTGTHSGRTRRRPEHQRGNKQHEAARPHRGPGGSRIGPLGGSQRLFQRICVPAEPRRWQASTTRAAMPASADLPHVRGSYCFLMPTSPSILRTPS